MFKPMLAVNTKVKDIKLPVYGSVKLEGVRAEFTPDGLFTRPMKKFGNPFMQIRFADMVDLCRRNNMYMEGEFYMHGMKFNDISSICRKHNHEDTDKLNLYLFDCYDPGCPEATFHERIKYLRALPSSNIVKIIHQEYHTDRQGIEDEYCKAIGKGYEGYVLKDIQGTYKHGRSTHKEHKFLRIKQENTYDGKVLEIVERFENLCPSEINELGRLSKRQDKDMKAHTGLAAVAVVKSPDFNHVIRVTLSRGLTDSDRAEIWDNRESYIGKHLRFVGIPVNGMLPRAPRFDAWRTDLD